MYLFKGGFENGGVCEDFGVGVWLLFLEIVFVFLVLVFDGVLFVVIGFLFVWIKLS